MRRAAVSTNQSQRSDAATPCTDLAVLEPMLLEQTERGGGLSNDRSRTLKFEAEIVLAPDMGLSMRLPRSHRNYSDPRSPQPTSVGPAGHMGVQNVRLQRAYAVGQLHRQDARIDANEANVRGVSLACLVKSLLASPVVYDDRSRYDAQRFLGWPTCPVGSIPHEIDCSGKGSRH